MSYISFTFTWTSDSSTPRFSPLSTSVFLPSFPSFFPSKIRMPSYIILSDFSRICPPPFSVTWTGILFTARLNSPFNIRLCPYSRILNIRIRLLSPCHPGNLSGGEGVGNMTSLIFRISFYPDRVLTHGGGWGLLVFASVLWGPYPPYPVKYYIYIRERGPNY